MKHDMTLQQENISKNGNSGNRTRPLLFPGSVGKVMGKCIVFFVIVADLVAVRNCFIVVVVAVVVIVFVIVVVVVVVVFVFVEEEEEDEEKESLIW